MATKTVKTEKTNGAADALALLEPAQVRERREGLGLSRTQLGGLTGLPLSRVWAAETAGKTVTAEHRILICDALAQVAENGVPEHMKKAKKEKTPSGGKAKSGPTKADLSLRLVTVAGLLDEAASMKTLKELRALVEQVRAVVAGTAGPSQEPEPTVVEQTDQPVAAEV